MKPKMFTRRAGTPPSGLYVRFGYVEGHSLPWEGYRAGQIVERPADELGHGVIVGATGSGKTVASYPVIYYPVVGGGWGSIVVDFKASAKTREAVRAAALAAGKPFIALQVGTPVPGEEPAFYEPFNWAGTPEEKASMLLSCFDMTTEGAASYYTSVAQGWLRFCFRLLEHTGLSNGEYTMDFLLRMCSTAEAKSAIKKVSRTNAPAADHLTRAIGHTITDKDLAGLKSQLQNIADPLAPNLSTTSHHPGRTVFDPTQISASGAIGYVSISAANESVVKGVGTLILQHLTSVMQVRMRGTAGGEPMVILIDEASALGDKAVVVETLLKQAREARMWVWLATQQLSAWPQSVQTAILGNASTIIALRSDDIASAEQLSANSGFGLIEVEKRQGEASAAVGGEKQTIGRSKQRTVEPGHPLVDPGEFQNLPNHQAYIWFRSIPNLEVDPDHRVPATPRQWTDHPRLRKGWEKYFNYDIPIVAIVPPSVMLEAANTAQENHLTNATSNNTAVTNAVWTPLPTAPVPSTHTASEQPAPPELPNRPAPPEPWDYDGFASLDPSYDRPGQEEDGTSYTPAPRFSTSRRASIPPPVPPRPKATAATAATAPGNEPVQDGSSRPVQQNHPPASPWAPVVDDD